MNKRINVQKRCRRLETISQGDTLIFPDREETIRRIDSQLNILLTERTKFSKGWEIIEQKSYDLSRKLLVTSRGRVYDSTKVKRIQYYKI